MSCLLVLVVSCGDTSVAHKPAPASTPAGNPESDASRDGRTRLGPFALDDLTITPRVQRGGEVTVKITAALEVVDVEEGGLEIPLRVACQFDSHRVVTTTSLVSRSRKRFNANAVGRGDDVFALAPVGLGWLGRPTACSVRFRLSPNRGRTSPTTQAACWTLMGTRTGACPEKLLPELAPPAAAWTVHGVGGDLALDTLRWHGHLQRGASAPPNTSAEVRTRCGDSAPSVVDTAPLLLEDGESVALSISEPLTQPTDACSVSVTTIDAGVSFELGRWCVGSGGVTTGACQR